MQAFVLIKAQSGAENAVIRNLHKLDEVVDDYILFGEWDILLKVELPSPEALATFVMEKIRTIKEVSLTSTLIVAK